MTVAPSSTYIPTDSAIFQQIDPDYSLLDAEGRLNSRYQHLPRDVRSYILAEHHAGRERNALRVANCHTTGVVYEECENGDTARAHSNLCHDDGCLGCGTAKSQLYVWTATRDEEKLYHEPHQFGIELTIPKGGTSDKSSEEQSAMVPGQAVSRPENPAAVRSNGNDRSCTAGDARSLRQGRNRMLASSGRFFRELEREGISFLIADVVDGSENTRLRAVVQNCYKNFPALLKLWKQQEPQGEMSLRRDLGGKKLFTWVMLLTEPLLFKDGALRSQILAEFRDCHLIRTVGSFYSPLSKEQLKERKAERDRKRCKCNACGGNMVKIPVEQRYSEPPEQINHRYRAVDWSSERSDLIASRPIAVRLGQKWQGTDSWGQPTHSPPS